jgi:endoglucanase
MQYFIDEGITVGINVGNSLDAVRTWSQSGRPSPPIAEETAWSNPSINQTYLNGLKTLGFNIVRIPVTWTGHIGAAPNYTVSTTRLARVAAVANMANNAGLKVIINIHHDGNHNHGFDNGNTGFGCWLDIRSSDATMGNKFETVWKQIAEHFKNYGDWLMFQGFNEIHDGDWGSGTPEEYTIINDWNQRFTNAVRGTGGNNATRFLLYYGYNTSYTIAGSNFSHFKLPTDTATGKQIVGFHFYYPYDFAHDGKNHLWPNTATGGTQVFIDTDLGSFKTNFVDKGIPVIIGENGPSRYTGSTNTTTARDNRLAYVDYMYGKARENGLIPCFWDNGASSTSDFGLINRTNGQPNSNENRAVVERMIAAIKNATPPTPPTPPGDGTAAVFTSWNAGSDSASTITHTTPSAGRNRIQGTLTGNEGYANLTATPDTATLAGMRTMKSFSFMVSGDAKQYDVMIITPQTEASGHNHYRVAFTASSSGAGSLVTVNVPSGLTQPSWGTAAQFIQNNVQSFQFQLAGTGPFDLTVWDIKLHQ